MLNVLKWFKSLNSPKVNKRARQKQLSAQRQSVGRTYEVKKDGDEDEYIHCLICDSKSYNDNDIKYRFCGNCKEYHWIMTMENRQTNLK